MGFGDKLKRAAKTFDEFQEQRREAKVRTLKRDIEVGRLEAEKQRARSQSAGFRAKTARSEVSISKSRSSGGSGLFGGFAGFDAVGSVGGGGSGFDAISGESKPRKKKLMKRKRSRSRAKSSSGKTITIRV